MEVAFGKDQFEEYQKVFLNVSTRSQPEPPLLPVWLQTEQLCTGSQWGGPGDTGFMQRHVCDLPCWALGTGVVCEPSSGSACSSQVSDVAPGPQRPQPPWVLQQLPMVSEFWGRDSGHIIGGETEAGRDRAQWRG